MLALHNAAAAVCLCSCCIRVWQQQLRALLSTAGCSVFGAWSVQCPRHFRNCLPQQADSLSERNALQPSDAESAARAMKSACIIAAVSKAAARRLLHTNIAECIYCFCVHLPCHTLLLRGQLHVCVCVVTRETQQLMLYALNMPRAGHGVTAPACPRNSYVAANGVCCSHTFVLHMLVCARKYSLVHSVVDTLPAHVAAQRIVAGTYERLSWQLESSCHGVRLKGVRQGLELPVALCCTGPKCTGPKWVDL